jgi:hypothetical protein
MRQLLGTWLVAVTKLESGNEKAIFPKQLFFSGIHTLPSNAPKRQISLLTGRKSCHQYMKPNLKQPLFKSHYRSLPKDG